MTAALLQVNGLSASYGPIRALSDVTLEVADGSVVALLGPNGAGKSTLVKCLTGLLRSRSGTITLDGRQLAGRAPEKVAALGMAVVPEGRRLFPGMSVEDNLLAGAYRYRRDRAGTAAVLESVYVLFPPARERARQLAGSLSGGEQQMVAVGRALMSRPRLLVLDEPSLGLAPKVVQDMYAALAEVHRTGTAMLLIEQNVAMATRICDRGYVLVNGRVVANENAGQLRDVAAETYLRAG
jgi:branched-chain amino acid transport system ATP-binding protein